MKTYRRIAAIAAVSTLALSSAVCAHNEYGVGGRGSESHRNFGAHPVDNPPPERAPAKGQLDPATPKPDASDQFREGRANCDDPVDRE